MGIEAFSKSSNSQSSDTTNSANSSSKKYETEQQEETHIVDDWYGDSMPNIPPATDGPNKETIFFDIVSDEEWAREVASAMGWFDAQSMDTVAHIIRDDFREFFIPLNSNSGSYESILITLKDDHLSTARKYNDDVTYDKEVKKLDVGPQDNTEDEEKEYVDWDDVMGSSDTDNELDKDSLDQELDDVFG